MSRLESSVINLHKTKCDINESILDAITSVYRKAKNKNINIEFNTENKIEIKSDHIVSDDYGKKGNVETWKQRKKAALQAP